MKIFIFENFQNVSKLTCYKQVSLLTFRDILTGQIRRVEYLLPPNSHTGRFKKINRWGDYEVGAHKSRFRRNSVLQNSKILKIYCKRRHSKDCSALSKNLSARSRVSRLFRASAKKWCVFSKFFEKFRLKKSSGDGFFYFLFFWEKSQRHGFFY